MTDKELVIVIDNSNRFNAIFFTLAKEFQISITQLGRKCELSWGNVQTNARKLIFGAHNSPEYWQENSTPDDIIVNLEAFHSRLWRRRNPRYLDLLENKCVFEYSQKNLLYLENKHFFKIPPMYSYLRPTKVKDLDILFNGSRNVYRNEMLNKIKETGLNLQVDFNVLLDDVFHAFDRSWIYLNLDLDEHSDFNDHRFMQCAMSNTLFVGHSGDIINHTEMEKLIGISIFEKDEDVIEGLQRLISDKTELIKAFSTQYQIAQENKKLFDGFVERQFGVK